MPSSQPQRNSLPRHPPSQTKHAHPKQHVPTGCNRTSIIADQPNHTAFTSRDQITAQPTVPTPPSPNPTIRQQSQYQAEHQSTIQSHQNDPDHYTQPTSPVHPSTKPPPTLEDRQSQPSPTMTPKHHNSAPTQNERIKDDNDYQPTQHPPQSNQEPTPATPQPYTED